MFQEHHRRTARRLIRFLSVALNYPVFKLEIVTSRLSLLVRKNSVCLEEFGHLLKIMHSNGVNLRIRQLFQALFYMQLTRSVSFIYLVHYVHGLAHGRVHRLRTGHSQQQQYDYYSYACLLSNCSSVFDGPFKARYLRELPIYTICYPQLSSFNEPFQNSYPLATVLFVSCNVYAMCMYFLLGRYQALRPIRHSMFVFLVAPELARAHVTERGLAILADVRRSLEQYCRMLYQPDFTRRRKSSLAVDRVAAMAEWPSAIQPLGYDAAACLTSYKHLATRDRIESRAESSVRESGFALSQGDTTGQDQQDEQFVADCLPLIRSEWWHARVSATCLSVPMMSLLTTVNVIIFTISRNSGIIINEYELMRELKQVTSLRNCSIWTSDHLEDQLPVDVDSLNFRWTFYSLFNISMIMIVWPSLSALAPMVCLLFSYWELRVWAFELKYKLVILLPTITNLLGSYESSLAQQQDYSQLDSPSAKTNSWPRKRHSNSSNYTDQLSAENRQAGASLFSFGPLNEKFIQDVWVGSLVVYNEPLLKLRTQLKNQLFIRQKYEMLFIQESTLAEVPLATRLAHREQAEATLAEILEKLYVQFRLLGQAIEEVGPANSQVTLIFVTVNYTVSFLTVMASKYTNCFEIEVWAMIVVCLSVPISLIVNSAIQHAQACECYRMLRPILAQISRSRNVRIQHMRTLWMKLLEANDQTNMNTLGLSHVRFTYVNLIQILIGTATLLAAVLRI